MKVNDRVTFVDAKGKAHPASVSAVVGAGESNYKTLNVRYDGGTTTSNVPHFGDHAKGQAYWLLETETAMPPERRADIDKQPAALSEAQGAGKLPESDRRSPNK